jgi:hypothetical protein
LLAFVMFGASKHYTKINLIGGCIHGADAMRVLWTAKTGLIMMHDDDIHIL